MNRIVTLGMCSVVLLLAGCVTTGVGPAPVTEAVVQDLSPVRAQVVALAQVAATSDAAIPETVNPEMGEALVAMQARHGEVQALKAQGSVGESNRGYLRLQDVPLLQDRDVKNAAQKVLAAENKNRKQLFRYVTEENRNFEGLTVSLVEGFYAFEQLKQSAAGARVQLPKSGPLLEESRALDAVKALGAEAEADTWVNLP